MKLAITSAFERT